MGCDSVTDCSRGEVAQRAAPETEGTEEAAITWVAALLAEEADQFLSPSGPETGSVGEDEEAKQPLPERVPPGWGRAIAHDDDVPAAGEEAHASVRRSSASSDSSTDSPRGVSV